MHDRPHPSRSLQSDTARTTLHRIGRAPARGLAASVAMVRIVRLARLSRLDAGAGDSFVEDRISATADGSVAPDPARVSAGVR